MSSTPVIGRWYPAPPPSLPGENIATFTDRLTGADRSNRRPYDHRRRRQCSIGYHLECTWWRELRAGAAVDDQDGCGCPCHTDTPPPADAVPTLNIEAASRVSRLYDLPQVSGQRVVYLAQQAVEHDGVTTLTGLADAIGRAYGSIVDDDFATSVAWALHYVDRLDDCPPEPAPRGHG